MNDETSHASDDPATGPPPAAFAGADGSNAPAGSGNEFVDRLSDTLHQTIDAVAARAAPHLQQVQDGLDEAQEQISESAAQLRALPGDWSEGLRGLVREHPLAALGTALACGMLIARMSR